MKSKNKKRLAVLSVVGILLLTGNSMISKKLNSNQSKTPLGYTVDAIYDMFAQKDDEKLSDNEQITKKLLESKDNFRSEQDLVYFFRQLEIQSNEYTNSYEVEKSKNSIRLYNNMCIDFIVKGLPNRGYTYENLPYNIKNKVLESADDINYMDQNGYPKEKEDIKEYEQILNKVIKDFVHAE